MLCTITGNLAERVPHRLRQCIGSVPGGSEINILMHTSLIPSTGKVMRWPIMVSISCVVMLLCTGSVLTTKLE